VPDYGHLEEGLDPAGPAEPDWVSRLRKELGSQVPNDYLAFMTSHDGGSGAIGVLQSFAEVGLADDLFPELDHLRGLVVFVTDGGGKVFAFAPNGTVVVVPWIGGPQDAVPQGTFTEFSRRFEQRLFDRDA
jgi:hypothetical protein